MLNQGLRSPTPNAQSDHRKVTVITEKEGKMANISSSSWIANRDPII
jgi:hypothetical protein